MMGESTSDLKLREPELRRETESPLRFSESVFLQSGQTAVASNTGGPHQPVSLWSACGERCVGESGMSYVHWEYALVPVLYPPPSALPFPSIPYWLRYHQDAQSWLNLPLV